MNPSRTRSPHLIAVTACIIGIVAIYLGRTVHVLFENIALLVSFILIIKHRHSIAIYFKRIPLRGVWLYLVTALPFMLFEENINCFPEVAGGCTLFPPTIPLLVIFVLCIYAIVKLFKIHKFWVTLILTCSIGIVWEVFVGVEHAQFKALPPFWFAFVSLWMWMSYAYFVVIPLTLITEKK